MTENLLHKLEEKMMLLLTEVEDLREEVERLSQENTSLKIEREGNSKKLQDLILLLDAVSITDNLSPVVSMTQTTLIQDDTNVG
jgi:regulator of replication initiation timing